MKISLHFRCKLLKIPEDFFSSTFFITVRGKSPYLPLIFQKLQKAQSTVTLSTDHTDSFSQKEKTVKHTQTKIAMLFNASIMLREANCSLFLILNTHVQSSNEIHSAVQNIWRKKKQSVKYLHRH